MALLETVLQPSVAVGFAAGVVGLRWVASTTGMMLRPVAKGVVKGAFVVSDGIGAIIAEARGDVRAGGDDERGADTGVGVAIRVEAPTSGSGHAEREPRRKPAARAQRPSVRKARSRQD